TGSGLLSGLSALADYTMLAEPGNRVLAYSADEWNVLARHEQISELTIREPGCLEIEIWKYSPALFAKEGRVDRLSLFLAMRDSADERVQSALDSLLRGMEW
ncbi:MAG: hypothetical protein WC712_01905, partial [Candidatus Brocadiia bacterium]